MSGWIFAQTATTASQDDQARISSIMTKVDDFYLYGLNGGGLDKCLKWLNSVEGERDIKFLTEHYEACSTLNLRTLANRLAGTASKVTLPFLLKALVDSDVGDKVLDNLAVPGDTLEQKILIRRTLAPLVAAWLKPSIGRVKVREETITNVISMLPRLDADFARQTLCTDEFLSPSGRWVSEVLDSFSRAHVALPEARVQSMLETWKPAALRIDAKRNEITNYVSVLQALALTDSKKCLSLTFDLQRLKPDETFYSLWPVIMEANGLGEFHDRIFDALGDTVKFDALPIEAKRYVAVLEILAIANEGIEQVFTSSAYNEWQFGMQGFEAIGHTNYVKFLRNVERLFGENGVPRDFDERQKVIQTMSPSFTDQVERIYGLHSKATDPKLALETTSPYYLLSLYAAKHAHVLRKSVEILKRSKD